MSKTRKMEKPKNKSAGGSGTEEEKKKELAAAARKKSNADQANNSQSTQATKATAATSANQNRQMQMPNQSQGNAAAQDMQKNNQQNALNEKSKSVDEYQGDANKATKNVAMGGNAAGGMDIANAKMNRRFTVPQNEIKKTAGDLMQGNIKPDKLMNSAAELVRSQTGDPLSKRLVDPTLQKAQGQMAKSNQQLNQQPSNNAQENQAPQQQSTQKQDSKQDNKGQVKKDAKQDNMENAKPNAGKENKSDVKQAAGNQKLNTNATNKDQMRMVENSQQSSSMQMKPSLGGKAK